MNAQTLESPAEPKQKSLAPDQKEVDQQTLQVIEEAGKILVITSQLEYEAVDGLVAKINKVRNGVKALVESFFKKHKDNARKAWQDLVDDEKFYVSKHDAPLAQLREEKLTLMRDYEELVKAENLRLQKEAAERQRREQDVRDREEITALAPQVAEFGATVEITPDELGCIKTIKISKGSTVSVFQSPQEYLQRVRQRLAEEAEKKRLAKLEEERLAKVDKLLAEGKEAEAEQVMDAAPPPPPPPAPPPPTPPPPRSSGFVPSYAVPKAKSVSTRKSWTWEPQGATPAEKQASFALLVQEAAKNPALLVYLTWDEDSLKALAKAKEEQAFVPGVRFFDNPIDVNARSK